ncbi:allantoinase AllB [Sporolactobacillus inulinus]|uniref:allantoinase n=1 Tax=Sporolactobacillus inulinus CASD TaxID=1069536 RepID=A0A0U1QSY0_9BACL|nr:allantoinase AllB [Sporolactobacillus inulinus]KLI03895.1 dihydroorotase [Sporolactobacillus inulinus CASD]GEB77504.1 amidohydrolase [Sporolactobacillus inulinus]
MHWDHLIKNGTIATPSETYQANLYIKEGKISAISKTALEGTAEQETDARGQYILPGLIDVHVHSRDPGPTYKEDFFTSTQAAAAGGITTIFDMPNTTPPTRDAASYQAQVANLTPKAHVDFGLWGIALGPMNNAGLPELHDAGVIGIKYFWGYAVNKNTFQLTYNYEPGMTDVLPPLSDGEVYEIFQNVAKTGNVLAIHGEDSSLIQTLTEQVKKSGRDDYEALLDGRPNLAEEVTVQMGTAFSRASGAKLHVLHVTTAEAADAIRRAQAQGAPVSAETCPHYLFLSNEDYPTVGAVMKIYPPVKYKRDQQALWQAINDGTITIISSDHAPHTAEEKSGSLWKIPAGMPGTETMAPLMLNAVNEGRLSLQKLTALMSENPAKRFGIYPRKGSLEVGTDADITIVDLNKETTIKAANLHSKSKVTAYDGWRVKGIPVQTIVRGETIMKNGEIIHKPMGRVIKPGN